MFRHVRLALAAGLLPVVTVFALAGCNSDTENLSVASSSSSAKGAKVAKTPSAAELYAQTRKAALAAKSGHLVADMTEGGKRVHLDIAGTADGTNQRLKTKDTDGEVTILTVGGKEYLTAGAKFWAAQGGGQAAKQFKDKYVLLPKSQEKSLDKPTFGSLLTEMFKDAKLSFLQKANFKAEKTTLGGVDAWKLTDRIGADGAALIVSADGKATLLKVIGPKGDPGDMLFSEWNVVPKVTAPAASKVIKIPS